MVLLDQLTNIVKLAILAINRRGNIFVLSKVTKLATVHLFMLMYLVPAPKRQRSLLNVPYAYALSWHALT